jgi:hypothetical protein
MAKQAIDVLIALAEAAIKFGPFLFCMIFLLIIVGKADRMYREYLKFAGVAKFDYRGWPYILYFYGAIALSFLLVIYSVYWWSTKQRDWYAFVFEVDGVPSDGKIEICNAKYAFYGKPSWTDEGNRYKKYQIVVLRDEQIVSGYAVKLKYYQPQSQLSQISLETGCTLLAPYRPGSSVKTFLLPSVLPQPNDKPKPLDSDE